MFRQTAWPNPTFIFESAETFEGLIAIDPAAREVGEWHGLAVRDVVKEIAQTAVEVAKAPLVSMQCPAQLPTIVKTRNHDLSTRKEIAAPSSSLAVRFAIALRDVSAATRFELADRISELCEKQGFGLWIADTRPGHRPGNWFEVCPAVTVTSSLYNGDLRSRQPIGTCLPITCAGPARVGATLAIASFLQRYPDIGVVGCAETSLSDVAFIHLLLSVPGVSVERLNRILGKLLHEHSAPARPRKLLQELFTRLGLRADGAGADAAADPAGDYQTFVGPALAGRPSTPSESLAVWVSWEMARRAGGLAEPLRCFYRALNEVVPEVDDPSGVSLSKVATVEYLICRATDRPVVRGKAKFAVPKAVLRRFSGGIEPPAAILCAALEDAWKAEADRSGVDGVSELTVAWREFWLGHWVYR